MAAWAPGEATRFRVAALRVPAGWSRITVWRGIVMGTVGHLANAAGPGFSSVREVQAAGLACMSGRWCGSEGLWHSVSVPNWWYPNG